MKTENNNNYNSIMCSSEDRKVIRRVKTMCWQL